MILNAKSVDEVEHGFLAAPLAEHQITGTIANLIWPPDSVIFAPIQQCLIWLALSIIFTVKAPILIWFMNGVTTVMLQPG